MTESQISGPVLVTGATGFIGRRLVGQLIARGLPVRALVLPEESTAGLWPGDVEVLRGDVRDADAVRRAVAGMRTIYHLAAVVGDWGPPDLFQTVAEDGTRNVLSAAADQDARAVLTSSITVYGPRIASEVCGEDTPFGRDIGPYIRAKQAQERIARRLMAERGLQIAIMRLANVYGPGSGPWADSVAGQLRAGLPALIGDGEHNAGLTYVDNVVDALLLAGAHPDAVGRTYNICDGLDVTWRRYFTDVAEAIGADPPKSIPRPIAALAAAVSVPLWRLLGIKSRPPLTREALMLVGSHHRVPADRLREELGWEPAVSYEQGLHNVIRYLREKAI